MDTFHSKLVLMLLMILMIGCVSIPARTNDPVKLDVREGLVISEDFYKKTFNEIDELVILANRYIAKKDYNGWITLLSNSYKEYYSNDVVLGKINSMPNLQENNIVIKNIRDYFNLVVVPSRLNIKLYNIVFKSDNFVTAYSNYKGTRAKLYDFEKIDEQWKITDRSYDKNSFHMEK